MELVAAKNEIDNEIDEIDDEILRQRELHARQMEQNIIEQKSKGSFFPRSFFKKSSNFAHFFLDNVDR